MKTLFEIAKSGLRSAERSLSVTSNNVINADTVGYSRQRVDKEPVSVSMTGYEAGLGVNITQIKRLRSDMIDMQLNQKRQDMGYMEGKARVFEQMEAFMATDSGMDLDLHISQLFDAFSELSTDPQDFSVRNNVMVRAEQLTDKLGEMSRGLDNSSEMVRNSAFSSLKKVNLLLNELSSINQTIVQSSANGQPDHSAQDLQVRKLEELSELIGFDSQVMENGALELRMSGLVVLDESGVKNLRSEVNDIEKTFRLRLDNGTVVDVEGGKLGADIEMYEQDIPELREQLDSVASTLVQEFNDIHIQGYGLEDNTVRNFFNPVFTTADEIQVNNDLKTNHQHIAASDQPGEAGNGEIASQLADIRNDAVISGRKLTDYAIGLISSPGENVSDLKSKIEARDSEIQMLTIQQEQVAGVNVDEELSLMIQYQNAYQGAARVMSAAQKMYDTLISITA